MSGQGLRWKTVLQTANCSVHKQADLADENSSQMHEAGMSSAAGNNLIAGLY